MSLQDRVRKQAVKRGYQVSHSLLGRRGYQVVSDVWRRAALALGDVQLMFDVGANVGQTARTAAARFPRAGIWSFEPDPATFVALRAAVSDLPAVTAVQLALGATDGTANFHRAGSSVASSLLSPIANQDLGDWTVEVGAVEVPVRRLDSFCVEHGIERIDLLKSDTQGGEMMLFEGAGDMLTPTRVRAVLCEVLFRPLYEDQAEFIDVHRAMLDRGYQLAGLYDAWRDQDQRIGWADALYV